MAIDAERDERFRAARRVAAETHGDLEGTTAASRHDIDRIALAIFDHAEAARKSGIRDGAAKERERVVAWLREEARTRPELPTTYNTVAQILLSAVPEIERGLLEGYANSLSAYDADAISRGEHGKGGG